MRLRFEEWLNRRYDMNYDAKKLFSEGIICYGVKAYRASFLMTYVGFLSVLKFRLLNSDVPLNFKKEIKNEEERKKQWRIECDKLRNEYSWEFEMKNQLEKQDNVFLISETLKKQLNYWREIRNICAHAKEREITYADVESFWIFIQNYYDKIVVNGGMEALKIKFNNHYNSEITPPNLDVKYIVEKITDAMPREKIIDFLSFAYEESKLNNIAIKYNNKAQFWKYIINSENDILKEEFFNFMKENSDKSIIFMILEPSLISYFDNDINFLWRLIDSERFESIFRWNYSDENIWIVIDRLLKLDVFKCEKNKLKKYKIFESVSEEFKNKELDISKDKICTLIKAGFLEFLEEKILNDKKFEYPDELKYANLNHCLIKFYLENKDDLDKYIILKLMKIYNDDKVYYGDFFDMMKDLITNKDIKNKIDKYKNLT
ncbi:hypothetical protein ACQR24_09320 [Clostridium perfringens]